MFLQKLACLPLIKGAVLLVSAIVGVAVLSACTTSDDPGDREFFNRGWLNPRDLDTDDQMHRFDRRRPPELPPNYKRDPLVD